MRRPWHTMTCERYPRPCSFGAVCPWPCFKPLFVSSHIPSPEQPPFHQGAEWLPTSPAGLPGHGPTPLEPPGWASICKTEWGLGLGTPGPGDSGPPPGGSLAGRPHLPPLAQLLSRGRACQGSECPGAAAHRARPRCPVSTAASRPPKCVRTCPASAGCGRGRRRGGACPACGRAFSARGAAAPAATARARTPSRGRSASWGTSVHLSYRGVIPRQPGRLLPRPPRTGGWISLSWACASQCLLPHPHWRVATLLVRA
ncbi:hypothetical protein H1C71_007935 [Ictidomys tridecemlineatus]|nr:hypothetical protein H1C71_007935 [Ictidomys tridecemlineatus]